MPLLKLFSQDEASERRRGGSSHWIAKQKARHGRPAGKNRGRSEDRASTYVQQDNVQFLQQGTQTSHQSIVYQFDYNDISMYLQLKRLFEVHCVDATIVWLDELEKNGRSLLGPLCVHTLSLSLSLRVLLHFFIGCCVYVPLLQSKE